MILTPRNAINCGQVWLRPFGHFVPHHQGYMGFSTEKVRNTFVDKIEDGALVMIWTRHKNGESGWAGKFRGILQLSKSRVAASAFSSPTGESLRVSSDKEFSFAARARRAWEADPKSKVDMKQIIPSLWPGSTQSIGTHSAKMPAFELNNIEPLRIREVPVWREPTIISGPFDEVRNVIK